MQVIRVSDNTQIENAADTPGLLSKLADSSLKQLQESGVLVFPRQIKDSSDLDEKQSVVRLDRGKYWTTNVMGFIGYKDERMIIHSRFGNPNDDYFTTYLISRVLRFPTFTSFNSNLDYTDRLYEYLLVLFPQYLRSAMRKGPYKGYVIHRENGRTAKGSINVARHIRDNTPFIGNVAYDQRLFSYDNKVMQLVRHTIEYMRRLPQGKDILRLARDEVELVTEVTRQYQLHARQRIIRENMNAPIRHGFYKEYFRLQKLCLLILFRTHHNVGRGSNYFYGMLFDGAWLWEEYIHTLLKDDFYHPRNRERQHVQALFNKNKGHIYPDFISINPDRRIIADAKYKPVKNIRSQDYLQLLAYMYRFDAKQGFYLYPSTSEDEDETLLLNRGSTFEKNVTPRKDIIVRKEGLHIPQDTSDYESFITAIRANESSFTNIFR